jgi:ABC-type molybdenum transport system ATPase subunit/photorepair protein PhrA
MSKISIQLSKEYKSFQPETFFLEGDLIILTGVNGSGKSQLLDIIRKVTYADTKNNNQQTKIDSVTKKDNVEIPESRVMYKSFKDLINIPQIQSVNQKQINFDLAWNWLVSGFQPSNTIGYTKCAATLESNLKTKEYVFGGNNENEKSRFKKSFSDDCTFPR